MSSFMYRFLYLSWNLTALPRRVREHVISMCIIKIIAWCREASQMHREHMENAKEHAFNFLITHGSRKFLQKKIPPEQMNFGNIVYTACIYLDFKGCFDFVIEIIFSCKTRFVMGFSLMKHEAE